MFDDIVAFGPWPQGSRAIEVGAGTGIATGPLADRGLLVTALEPSPAMAAVAAHKLGDRTTIVSQRFEDWLPSESFDLLVACNAWHWIHPMVGLKRMDGALHPGSTLALAWTEIVSWGEEPFETRLAQELGSPWPKGTEFITDSLQSIRSHRRVDDLREKRYRFSRTLDAETYVAVKNTYGGPADPELDSSLRRLIDEEFGGSLTKVEEAVLYLAAFH